VERIAVLTGEPLPMKGDRTVPSGRWSFQPDGYFIRYFPDGYPTTLIEVYFPENFAIGRDASGRITSIVGQNGKRLEIEYDEAIARLAVNREPSLTGSAFRSVRLRYTFPRNPKIKTDLGTADMDEWRNNGWTFSGSIAGRGAVSPGAARYTGAGGRYEAARRNADELRRLADNLTKLPKGTIPSPVSAATADELLGLMQLASAMNDLMSGAGAGRAGLFFDPVEFVQRAWASEFARSVGIQPIAGSVDPVPSLFRNASYAPFESLLITSEGKGFGFGGGAASPGNQGRQREGISDTPKDPDTDCKANFSSCQDAAGMSNVACNLDCTSVDGAVAKYKCFKACAKSYAEDNAKCSAASKKCLRGGR
jgi:hypothetical protein